MLVKIGLIMNEGVSPVVRIAYARTDVGRLMNILLLLLLDSHCFALVQLICEITTALTESFSLREGFPSEDCLMQGSLPQSLFKQLTDRRILVADGEIDVGKR